MSKFKTASPSLCLAMIVRNEAKILPRSLISALPYINAWHIIDTGSTDNTAETISRHLGGLPGELKHQPFSQFSSLRNQLLKEASQRADFVLMLDADEELLCLSDSLLPDCPFDAAYIEIQQSGASNRQLRLFRSGQPFEYCGAVYEQIISPADCVSINLDTGRITHHANGFRSRQAQRVENDIAYLQQALNSSPAAAVDLSLARVYCEAGNPVAAKTQLQRLAEDQSAPAEARWQANYMLGMQYRSQGFEAAAIDALLDAYDLDPMRAEALYYLAELMGKQQRWQDAYQLTALAIELRPPGAVYFERPVYDYLARLLHVSFCIELGCMDEAQANLQAIPMPRLDESARRYHEQLHQKLLMVSSQGAPTINLAGKSHHRPKLTIAMASYDDFDGVYFTLVSLLTGHAEVRDQFEIIVLDNHPSGVGAEALKNLCHRVDGATYHATQDINGTAVRTHLFDLAKAEVVLCIDCHVVILPGAIKQLIDYFDAHPESQDLLHGPLIDDNLGRLCTHMEPQWRAAMFGIWSYAKDEASVPLEPFEIPGHGMGLFACRKESWLGFNPRFSGFGGEEGYIHEKYRQHDRRVLCLPFLRWTHRFDRPLGPQYRTTWGDRIRNYLIGFDELGLSTREMENHFSDYVGFEEMAHARAAYELEKQNPFFFFDAIYCINLDRETERWEQLKAQAEVLGFAHRLRRFSAIETPDNHRIGCALSHRAILKIAHVQRYNNILVLEDGVVFRDDPLARLRITIEELKGKNWDLLYLGGHCWNSKYGLPDGCKALLEVGVGGVPTAPDTAHALAYHHHCYSGILNLLPDSVESMRQYLLETWPDIGQVYANSVALKCFIPESDIASKPRLMMQEEADFAAIIAEVK